MERKHILVAFGDIRGFRKWTMRAINAPETAGELINEVYARLENFTRRNNYYVKYLGDGLLIVRELSRGHNCGIARKFLEDTQDLAENMDNVLKGFYPRPDGFRIRSTSGHVWKRSTFRRLKTKSLKESEYIGYAVNMAQSLLYVYPDVLSICHESVAQLLGPKKTELEFKKLAPPKERRHGIDPQDFEGLLVVRRKDENGKPD